MLLVKVAILTLFHPQHVTVNGVEITRQSLQNQETRTIPGPVKVSLNPAFTRTYRGALHNGFFWKRTTATAALFAIIGGFACSVFIKFLPNFADVSFLQGIGHAALNPASGVIEIPFLDRMGFVFIICVIGMVIISLSTPAHKQPAHTLEVDPSMFRTSQGFAFGAIIILVMLATLYIIFW